MGDLRSIDMPSHKPRPQLYGRPRLDPAERRVRRLRVFLNDREDLKLRDDAAAAGMSVPEYVRALIAGHTPAARAGASDPRLVNEVNAIGVNLNTAVKYELIGSERRADLGQAIELVSACLEKLLYGDAPDVH